MTIDFAQNIETSSFLDAARVADRRLVLCDLDGCLVSSGKAFSDAPDFVQTCRDRLWILSNNSTHLAPQLAGELDELGVSIDPDRILLAGEQTLFHLSRQHPGAKLALYGSPSIRGLADKLGFDLEAARPEIALLCRDTALRIPELNQIAAQVLDGATLWVSNLDRSHPSLHGYPIAETGALLAAINAMLGTVEAKSIGKPNPYSVQWALERTGVPASQSVLVGDNPETDGAAAQAAGIHFLHVQRARAGS
ncbi:HAD hydrolase-like protein [Pikeienuella piscinae]|uniref:HAD hydrolase-like protein n=1 Tax=Pikeienuella piscinae TaxID=2748098 RepID=A0A7L5C1C0_9RHOB|nr:HAD hydrolase-like protein [Pikeienuella piscinae]QIE55649.1 HAD hydrolase-like protein [Pikeienuella piscinae]